MPNTFFLSLAPQIAAVSTLITTVDTVVDLIRGTDVPAIQANIDANETKIDLIRGTDVPAIQANIDAAEAKIDLIRGTDVPNLTTAINTRQVRGEFKIARATTVDTNLTNLVNINGRGKLLAINFIAGASGSPYIKIEIDSYTSNNQNISNPGTLKWIYITSVQTTTLCIGEQTTFFFLNLEFKTHLHITFYGEAPFSAQNAMCYYIQE